MTARMDALLEVVSHGRTSWASMGITSQGVTSFLSSVGSTFLGEGHGRV